MADGNSALDPQGHAPPRVFDWELEFSSVCGVSVDRSRALQDLHEAVREAEPGEVGVLHESVLGFNTEYYRLRDLGRITHDAATGFIVWQECR